MLKISSKLFAILCLCLAMTACSRITQDNFNKVRPNMTMQEVTAILGTPTSSESIDIGGISGTSAIWEKDDIQITIQFLNDKVLLKNFSKKGSSPMPAMGNENAG
ncbi:MAG: hypothetical protein A3F14_04880 [Gammaproteobacteria bacterium RIFCSPHIGHO2_12_FULL_43_28]|nr:MAG: hypothetical protein A3F14_04880 [Gammaproteobacteria bacterium RIFCSPHIGHO2_12_FULL_43_28]